MISRKSIWISILFVLSIVVTGCVETDTSAESGINLTSETVALSAIPEYEDEAYVAINNNVPMFSNDELTTTSYETYSELDELGRCGTAVACVGQDLMPTQERGNIGSVKPTGWQSTKYDIVDGKYLYNRCHLIGYQLTAENANKQNLITGTRYLNIEGMLPFENMVADYVKETGNHVLYRVTPVYDGDNLVASGVFMEGMSVEDKGEEIMFNVFAYNVQPGITIDYATGESKLASSKKTSKSSTKSDAKTDSKKTTYILNTSTMKYHLESCSLVPSINDENKETFKGSKSELENKGYEACGKCKP